MLCGRQDFWTDTVPTVPAQSFSKCNPIAIGHNNCVDAGQVVLGLFSLTSSFVDLLAQWWQARLWLAQPERRMGAQPCPKSAGSCRVLEALVQQGVIWAGHIAQAVPSSSIKKPRLVELVHLLI